MIHNDEEFEATLEEVIAIMDRGGEPGSEDDDRLHALLPQIRAYAPKIEPPPADHRESAERERLRRRVADFVKRREAGRSTVMGDVDALMRPIMGRH